ncbi:MAG: hypothetical protein ACLVF9_10660 [Enterocloster sp.]
MAPAHTQTTALQLLQKLHRPLGKKLVGGGVAASILHKDPVFYRASGTQPFQKAGGLHLRIVDSDLHHTQLSRLGEKPADHGPGNAQLRGNIALLLIV